MTISPVQLWYMIHMNPILVSDSEAKDAYIHDTHMKSKPSSTELDKCQKILTVLERHTTIGPKELSSFLQVLDNSLQEEIHNTLLLKKLEELRAFLSDTCAVSTTLTVETRKDGEKLVHEFVISASHSPVDKT